MGSNFELGYVEHCLPGSDSTVRLQLARELDLALEVAHRGETTASLLKHCQREQVPICTLQAYGLHEAHSLHPDPKQRALGLAHVRECIALAQQYKIPRVLCVAGFGQAIVSEPQAFATKFFAQLLPEARAAGIQLLIEPLSPKRCSAFCDPDEVQSWIHSQGWQTELGLALDTGHLLDSGLQPEKVIERCSLPIVELQLRGPDSQPLALNEESDPNWKTWLKLARPQLVTGEHHGTIPEPQLHQFRSHLVSQ